MTEYTLILEFYTATAWAGHIRQLPELESVQGCSLSEVQSKLTKQLVDWLFSVPGPKDLCINTEVCYRVGQSS